MNNPRKLANAERLEICEDALYWIAQTKEAVRDLWIEGFDCMLDDLERKLETMRDALEIAETSRAHEEADELRREYERGVL